MALFKNAYDRRDFLNRSSLSLGSLLAAGLPFSTLLANNSGTIKELQIPTIRGNLNATDLGTTLMHEHLLWFAGPTEENAGYTPIPENLRKESIDFAVSNLNDAARVGINTIVDLTPFRPIDLYQQIAIRTSVNIIVSTGFYRRSKVPRWMAEMDDEKQMEDRMLSEVRHGIDGTAIRAGIIKIAGEGGTEWQKKIYRSAARVNKATYVPIATHSGGDAAEQFDFLVRAGANPHQILLSHIDVGRKGRPGDLLAIAKAGGYLEVDTFGQNFYTPWEELVALLRAFCDAGLADKVIISIDSNWHWENGKKIFEGAGPPNFDANADQRTFSYMITDAVPKLLKSGFSMKEINTFLIHNPRNYFTPGTK